MTDLTPAIRAQLESKLQAMGVSASHEPAVAPGNLPSLVRVGTMLQNMLETISDGDMDETACARAAQVFDASVMAISDVVDDSLSSELSRMVPALGGAVSTATLRVVYCQVASWLSSVVSAEMARGALSAVSSFEEETAAPKAAIGFRGSSSPDAAYL